MDKASKSMFDWMHMNSLWMPCSDMTNNEQKLVGSGTIRENTQKLDNQPTWNTLLIILLYATIRFDGYRDSRNSSDTPFNANQYQQDFQHFQKSSQTNGNGASPQNEWGKKSKFHSRRPLINCLSSHLRACRHDISRYGKSSDWTKIRFLK